MTNIVALIITFGMLVTSITITTAQVTQEEMNLANEYFNDGEYNRAIELYTKMHKAHPEVEFYATRIVDCYLALDQNDQALEFTNKLIKKNQIAYQYVALKGKILTKDGKKEEAETLWNRLIAHDLKNYNDFIIVGSFFMNNQIYDYSKKTYLRGREVLGDASMFSNELGYLYRFEGNFEAATTEFLNLYFSNAGYLGTTKANISNLLSDETNAPQVEKALLAAVQKRPSDPELREILYDFYLQTSNFGEAIIQGRALDKQKKERGLRLFKLAQTLQNNKAYEHSNMALDYIISNVKDSPVYLEAYLEKTKNFELKAFDQRPLDTTALRKSIDYYDELFKQFGRQEALYEAMYRKARLLVFYLNDLNQALAELEQIDRLALPNNKKAEAKLLTGDVNLLQGRYLQAKLQYNDVEQQFKEGQVGAMARFRISQLAYFKGEFEQAKEFLKILKDNTSNDIANDALRLYLTIQDNLGLDTSATALNRFANIQLLVYQKRYAEALPLLDSLQYAFPNHPLQDDILWERANILLNQSKVEDCLKNLDKILTSYPESILADDALFTKAEIYELIFKDKKKAEEYYLEILSRYSASLYKVEARKRVRKLRGAVVG